MLRQWKSLRQICKDAVKGFVFDDDLVVAFAEDVGSLIFEVVEFLDSAEILKFETRSLLDNFP
jgi:hypothetical protein